MTSPEAALANAGANIAHYQPRQANGDGHRQEAQPPSRIVSSSAFVAGFRPPDYLIKGILQKRFFYSLTARTGEGKTAVVLLLTANVALGPSFAGKPVTNGAVLYFAGENPDDVRMRWIAMAEEIGFDVATMPVHFVPGVFPVSDLMREARERAAEVGGFALVIIDTSAAYFQGDDENANTQAGAYARELRALTGLPGGPCVVTCSHPTKRAANDDLIPRGGGAFLAEVDGNLTCVKDDTVLSLHWAGKFRGAGFEPIALELVPVTSDRLMDADGDPIWTVMARPISQAEQQDREKAARSDEDELLHALLGSPGASLGTLAETLGWTLKDGKPAKSRTHRTMMRLKDEKMVAKKRGRWELTGPGKAEAERLDKQAR